MLKHRLISAGIIVSALLLGTILLPPVAVWVILVAVAALAQTEFYNMLGMTRIPAFRIVGVLCGTVIISVTFWSLHLNPDNPALSHRWGDFALFASLIVVFVRQFPQKHNERPLATIACSLLGICYVPYLFNFFTRLIFSWESGETSINGRMLMLYLIAVVKCSDGGAYFVGRAFGRRKLVPRISPGKTWEGLGGAVLGAQFGGGLFCLIAGQVSSFRLPLKHALILGLLLAAAGVLGDLFESLLKRASGAKDSGNMLPGLGGVLDVLDSLLFAAPVLYFYVLAFLS